MRARTGDRPATIVVTDTPRSGDHVAELGDERWASLLTEHDRIVQNALRRYGGREVAAPGEGLLAAFTSQEDGIRCAADIIREVRGLGLEDRAAVHVGGRRSDERQPVGMAVRTGTRIMLQAAPGEVLVSGLVKGLVPGAPIAFEDRGEMPLRNAPDPVRVYAVRAIDDEELGDPLPDPEASARRQNVVVVPDAPRRRSSLKVAIIVVAIALLATIVLAFAPESDLPESAAPAPTFQERIPQAASLSLIAVVEAIDVSGLDDVSVPPPGERRRRVYRPTR